MSTKIAAICAIAAFAASGDRGSAQFPECATIHIAGLCSGTGLQVSVTNDRTDGHVRVTIRSTWHMATGTDTSTNQVYALAAGEKRYLGCKLPSNLGEGYSWSIVDCQPL
jgi:hypothetical protein